MDIYKSSFFKYVIGLIGLFSLGHNVGATHMAGGDITYKWLGPNQYKIQVRLTRDCATGNAGVPGQVLVGIYQLDNNVLFKYDTIPLDSMYFISLGAVCSQTVTLCRQELLYTSLVSIPDYVAGYYLYTQIYGRNTVAINIQSPGSTGMGLYTEMPDPGIGQNSSPVFSPYIGQGYFCAAATKSFYFEATDDDGDVLRYTFVQPLSTIGVTNTPFSKPSGGYPLVSYNSNYTYFNFTGSLPQPTLDLASGFFTVPPVPLSGGVFVFAVKVEEYRSGIKIGEVITDIQYLSLNCSASPVILSQPMHKAVYLGQTAIFEVEMANPTGANFYQWQIDDGTGFQDVLNAGQFFGATGSALVVNNATQSNHLNKFRCAVTVDGCVLISNPAILKIQPTDYVYSVSDVDEGLFTIYPNPVSELLFVSVEGAFVEASYQLIDMTGRIEMAGTLISGRQQVDLSQLSKGAYVVLFYLDTGKVVRKKLVKT